MAKHDRVKRTAASQDPADKVCARCGRPFSWRKKWERDWAQVRYCSDKCRMGKSAANSSPA